MHPDAQLTIVIIAVGAAVAYAVWRTFRNFTHQGNSCGSCCSSCCTGHGTKNAHDGCSDYCKETEGKKKTEKKFGHSK